MSIQLSQAQHSLATLAAGLLLGIFSPAASTAAPLELWVSIQPQRFVVEAIGEDLVSCAVLVGPGQSPETFEPTPQQLMDLTAGGRLIRIGVPFENTLLRRLAGAVGELEIVDGRRGIQLHQNPDRSGKGSTAHSHHGPDPHFWLDPSLFATHADGVFEAMARWMPEHRQALAERHATVTQELRAVDLQVRGILAPHRGRSFIVYHPAFGYFARRYGLTEVAVEVDGKAPGPRELARLIDEAQRNDARTVFVQKQFSHRSAEALAEAIDGTVVELDPLAEDYLDNLVRMAQAIATSYGGNELADE